MIEDLDRARWALLSPYLDEALDLPADARAPWLEALRAREPEMAGELEALLAELQTLEREDFLGRAPTPRPTLAGQALGAYTLREQIGQGGMGSVWLAERSDGRYEGVAAVKLLNVSLIGHEAEERFRREGSILARLRHPHIAHLIDAGVSPSGQPFLVLEHVDGEHLDDYCDRRELGVEARVRLFLDVLAAVAHAHANLIVHRDLKPSNVLVDSDGSVKLLDFGVAKLLETTDGGEPPPVLTREGQAALTPEYAAPEQLTGRHVTTATDVHALGVLLYVLLTGQHPAGPGARSPADLVRAIVETEPPRMSDAVGKKLKGPLRGDLDNIVARALKKEASERYASVAALADDLRRYLDHRPVSARADSLAYRAARFVRRNRAPVALASLAVVALAGGLMGTVTQARRAARQAALAARQRDFALLQLSRAEAINELNHFLLSDAAPGGKPFTVGDLLGQAERLLERQRGEPDESRAEILVAIGRQYLERDEDAKARRLLSEAYELSQRSRDPATRAKAACALADAMAYGEELERAESLAREGLGQLPQEPQFVLHRVFCLLSGGAVARAASQGTLAIERVQEAQRLLRESHQGSELMDLRVTMELAESHRTAMHLREAADAFEQAWAHLTALGRADTERAGTLLNNWALVVRARGQPLAAERLFRRAVRISAAESGEGSVSPMLLNNLARTLVDIGRLDEARDYAERANAQARRAGDEIVITLSLYLRSDIDLRLGDVDRAASILAELERRVGKYPSSFFYHGALASQQGLLAEARGDLAGARAAQDRAIALAGHQDLPVPLLRRSAVELRGHRPDAARADAERALAVVQESAEPGAPSSRVGLARLALARALSAQGKPAEAQAAFADALRHLEPTLGGDSPEVREARQSTRALTKR